MVGCFKEECSRARQWTIMATLGWTVSLTGATRKHDLTRALLT